MALVVTVAVLAVCCAVVQGLHEDNLLAENLVLADRSLNLKPVDVFAEGGSSTADPLRARHDIADSIDSHVVSPNAATAIKPEKAILRQEEASEEASVAPHAKPHHHSEASQATDPLKSHQGDSPLDLLELEHGPALNFCPDGVRVRKEFRDMTKEEWAKFKAALKKLYETKDKNGKSVMDRLTKIHLDFADVSHWTAHFLPWHRVFVWMMETELRKMDPDVTVPYWDWSYDARDPQRSEFFREEYLGLKRGRNGDCTYRVSYPHKHCVVRNYNSISGFYGKATVDRLLHNRGNSFDDFASRFEAGPHGVVHTELGGRGGDMTDMMSPNDPAFWLHHSHVEKIFVEWQTIRGRSDEFNGMHRGRRATKDDWLRPFKVRVRDALDHNKFCYVYQPFSRRVAGLNGPEDEAQGKGRAERVPIGRLTDDWIAMHHMDAEKVRALEAEMIGWEAEAEALNASPAAAKRSGADFDGFGKLPWIIAAVVVFGLLVALTVYFYRNL